MKVSLSEIWSFIDLISTEKISQVDLVLGKNQIDDVSIDVIQQIRKGVGYDTELLPDLFTNSEITWQPNEYASHKDCLAGLNILKHQCEIQTESLNNQSSEVSSFYANLIKKLENETTEVLDTISKEEGKLSRILGKFRKGIYPTIKFLLEHPANHPQIKFEAVLRQDFMAKTLFNEYHVKFSELIEPYWQVWVGEKPKRQKTSQKTDQSEEEVKSIEAKVEE